MTININIYLSYIYICKHTNIICSICLVCLVKAVAIMARSPNGDMREFVATTKARPFFVPGMGPKVGKCGKISENLRKNLGKSGKHVGRYRNTMGKYGKIIYQWRLGVIRLSKNISRYTLRQSKLATKNPTSKSKFTSEKNMYMVFEFPRLIAGWYTLI